MEIFLIVGFNIVMSFQSHSGSASFIIASLHLLTFSIFCFCCRGTGWNKRITHDIIDDSRDLVVVEMPCMQKKFEKVIHQPKHVLINGSVFLTIIYLKVHTTVYKSAVVPNILISEESWLHIWCISVTILSMYAANTKTTTAVVGVHVQT
jgi:hypothetical protein